MKTIIYRIIICISILGSAIVSCTNQTTSSIEVTNGDCTGRILNQNGTPAAGATVCLIPGDYTPMSPTTQTIDSTVTDQNGAYAFEVTDKHYYNIIAQKASASCLIDSVFLQPDSASHIEDLTLKASGYLTGVITLKPGNDPRNIVLLLRGTDLYVSPDSAGSFKSPALPQGKFDVRIFTSDQGYAVFDTFVVIREGAETGLFVTLASTDAPTIGGLTIEQDSSLMYLTLRWTPPDTSLLATYRLRRRHANGSDTTFLIDKSAKTFTDDASLFEDDTLTYQITAIGTNFREGYCSTFPNVVPHSRIVSRSNIILDYIEDRPMEQSLFAIAANGDILLISDTIIRRFNRDGTRIAEFSLPPKDNMEIVGYAESNDGNWYCVAYDFPGLRYTIRKLSPALVELRRISGKQPEYFAGQVHIEVSRSGSVYLSVQADTGSVSTIHCSVFNAALTLTNDYYHSIPGSLRGIVPESQVGDTVASLHYPESWNYSDTYQVTLDFFDPAFNLLWSFSDFDFFNGYRNPYEPYKQNCDPNFCFGGPGGTVIAYLDHLPPDDDVFRITLMISDGHGHMLARKVMRPPFAWDAPQFDREGNIYFRKCDMVTGQVSIHGYATEWLFGAR